MTSKIQNLSIITRENIIILLKTNQHPVHNNTTPLQNKATPLSLPTTPHVLYSTAEGAATKDVSEGRGAAARPSPSAGNTSRTMPRVWCVNGGANGTHLVTAAGGRGDQLPYRLLVTQPHILQLVDHHIIVAHICKHGRKSDWRYTQTYKVTDTQTDRDSFISIYLRRRIQIFFYSYITQYSCMPKSVHIIKKKKCMNNDA